MRPLTAADGHQRYIRKIAEDHWNNLNHRLYEEQPVTRKENQILPKKEEILRVEFTRMIDRHFDALSNIVKSKTTKRRSFFMRTEG